jgi:hypothetical protein
VQFHDDDGNRYYKVSHSDLILSDLADVGPFQEAKMRQLDETLGDLIGQYNDRVVDILVDVGVFVRDLEPALLTVDETIAELDWYVTLSGVDLSKPRLTIFLAVYSTLALASASQTFGLSRPRMVADNVLWIKGGRHVLYEMANETYVGNDTDLGMARRGSDEGSTLTEKDGDNLVRLQRHSNRR